MMQKTPNHKNKKRHEVLTQIGLPCIFGLQSLQS
jgi:hypothetical protein